MSQFLKLLVFETISIQGLNNLIFEEPFIGLEKTSLDYLYWSIIIKTFNISKLQIKLEIQKHDKLHKVVGFVKFWFYLKIIVGIKLNFQILQLVKSVKKWLFQYIYFFFPKKGQLLENSVVEYENKTHNTVEEHFLDFGYWGDLNIDRYFHISFPH